MGHGAVGDGRKRSQIFQTHSGAAARDHPGDGADGKRQDDDAYTALNEINDLETKIITIEDPVEYQMKGINQIQVNEKAGLTFARGLRSVLRHDPDVVLVGEIRDAETAQIAVQASLTGHLVFRLCTRMTRRAR